VNILLVAVSLTIPVMLHLTNVNSKHHTNPLQSPIMLHLTKVNSKHHTNAKQKLIFLHKTMPYNHNPYAHFSGCGVVWRGAWGEEEWIKQVQHCIVRNVTKRAHRIHLHCCPRPPRFAKGEPHETSKPLVKLSPSQSTSANQDVQTNIPPKKSLRVATKLLFTS